MGPISKRKKLEGRDGLAASIPVTVNQSPESSWVEVLILLLVQFR